jgi:carotenoid cleavage dioxygenase
MQITREAPLNYSLEPSNHPYLSGAWTPCHEEVTVDELEVIEGEVPADIDGIYLRNTENPVHQPLGRHHPFDGDAMIHQVDIVIALCARIASPKNRSPGDRYGVA